MLELILDAASDPESFGSRELTFRGECEEKRTPE
jgi:hypothetical protein